MVKLIQVASLWLAVAPVDMRCGVDRLTLLVSEALGKSWQSRGGFVFRNRRGTRIKVLIWDEHGVWLCYRRLHRGRFCWPKTQDKVWSLTQEQFEWLSIGVDWLRLSQKKLADWQHI